MSWVRVAWSKCTLLYVSYMLVQISFFISSIYIVFVFIDPKISTPMNQGRVPHNNLSFHRCIPPSYHNFIKWRPSTLDPVPRPGRPRNFVTMMRTLGFVLSNPSFHCFCYHVLRQIRLAMPRNNFVVQSVSGGIIIMACSLLIMLLLERNSGMPSEALIFLRVLWRGN